MVSAVGALDSHSGGRSQIRVGKTLGGRGVTHTPGDVTVTVRVQPSPPA